LEQSGLLVVPISYLDTDEEIMRMMKEVNAVYVCGDSHKAVANKRYQQAFSTVLKYTHDSNKGKDKYGDDSEYFPMFVMGKGL
jgi:hypothetical protein|tara:strand:+ start:173 stop:421 length:249 start_codon:yes stop_codon:yes gene_type:complete